MVKLFSREEEIQTKSFWSKIVDNRVCTKIMFRIKASLSLYLWITRLTKHFRHNFCHQRYKLTTLTRPSIRRRRKGEVRKQKKKIYIERKGEEKGGEKNWQGRGNLCAKLEPWLQYLQLDDLHHLALKKLHSKIAQKCAVFQSSVILNVINFL